MRFSYLILGIGLIIVPPPLSTSAQNTAPLTPRTASTTKATLPPQQYVATLIPPFSEIKELVPSEPTRLQIPRIKLDAPVQNVGINDKGEMDVPSGKSNNVGWYAYGTKPGEVGSAVMDAHVFAAFSKLKNVKVGDHLYVSTEAGEQLDFVVSETRVYKLEEVPREKLFAQNDTERLNLITCAGKYISSRRTYSHRLIVYATLAN